MYNTDLPRRAELPSSRQLLVSTLLAMLTAGVLLVTVVLPAEYGVDPTGVGRALGLTAMGEIKRSLAEEAMQAQAPAPPAPPMPSLTPAPAPTSPAPAPALPSAAPAPAPVVVDAAPQQQSAAIASSREVAVRSDEMTVSLKPGEAAEIKLVMAKGARVNYEWVAQGGAVNYDAHGDPVPARKGFYHGYGKGRATLRDAGELVAAFDGSHGWFWRNRSGSTVTLTLRTRGAYTSIKRVA